MNTKRERRLMKMTNESVVLKENKTKNPKRIGIDTSVIVNLIIKDIDIFKFREKEFLESDFLYYAMRTKYEFKGVMLNKFGFNKKEKNRLWRRAKSALKLNPIKIGKRDILKYLDKARKANAILIENINPRSKANYKIGEEDIEIIANFLKWKISKVYTSDRAFYETCKVLGLKSELIRISEYLIMKKRL